MCFADNYFFQIKDYHQPVKISFESLMTNVAMPWTKEKWHTLLDTFYSSYLSIFMKQAPLRNDN